MSTNLPRAKPMSARKASVVATLVVVLVAVPPPWMWVKPTNPSKSVICDGSLMSANGVVGLSGLWCTGTPKGLNGAPPPGIGLRRGPRHPLSSSSSPAYAEFARKRPVPIAAPAAPRIRLRRLTHCCSSFFQEIGSCLFIVVLLRRGRSSHPKNMTRSSKNA
jgi:hypothetical protein